MSEEPVEVIPQISPAVLASIYRTIRNVGGMLLHPESNDILSQEDRVKLMVSMDKLRGFTDLTDTEYHDFMKAGIDDVTVVSFAENEKKFFKFKDSKAQ